MRQALKRFLSFFGIDASSVNDWFGYISIKTALRQQKLFSLIPKLRRIVPDISRQESRDFSNFNAFCEIKKRGSQSFQCMMMLKAIRKISSDQLFVGDIGDSAGTHMLYLKELASDRELKTISINLDERAIEKIRKQGLPAICKRAEEITEEDLGGNIDLFTSFEMVEHLHNPCIFFKRLSYSCKGLLLITVPYVSESRVGLYNIRKNNIEKVFAEDVHVFELNPTDWELLLKHSGYRIVFQKIYYQYPRHIPILSWILSKYWKHRDFEGFWGALLEVDHTYSDLYQDWEE